MESLKEKTAKGLFWGGMNNGVQQLLGLVFGIVLGRLLDPSDYGMTAMLAVFSVIANELQSSGFKTGLINLREPRHEDYNAVFWFNIVAGALLYVVLWLAAPLIADYYHQPALVALSRYMFLGFVLSSFGIAQSAWLTKQMQIKQIAKCGMTATLSSSLVSVTMAALGFGYWALATQYLMYIAVNTGLMWHFSSWRPTLFSLHTPPLHPPRNIPPSSQTTLPLQLRIMLSAIFTRLNANVMNLLLGRYYGRVSTGHYNQAYQWSTKGSSLVANMLRQVDQTVLVGLTDERARQLAVLRKMVRFTAFIAFPLLFALAMVSHEFIVLAIGQKWAFAASLLPWLCVSGAFMPLSTLLTDAVISRHRSDIFLWGTVALGVLQIALLLVLKSEGILAMVMGYTALNIAWVFVWQWFVGRLMGYGFGAFLKDVVPFALAAAAVMVVTGYVVEFTVCGLSSCVPTVASGMAERTGDYLKLWVLFISKVLMAAVMYYAVMRLAGVVILKEIIGFVKGRL